jgi:hypothetical protein
MKNTKLKRYKQSQEKRNKEKIICALKKLRMATPSKILEFIDKQSEKYAKDYFKENNRSFTSEEFEKKKKEFSMVIRTVKSILGKLTNENLVIHNNGGIYCLNESINNFSLFPNPYGTSMIYSIGHFFPTTIESSLEEYVNRYGLFMIFAFLQLLNLKNSNEIKNENENENKESISYNYDTIEQNNIDQNSIDNWLRDAIPLKLMYDLFRTLYFNDNGKENTKTVNLKILNGLNKIIEKKYPLFYNEFTDKLKENIELTKISEHNTNEYIKAINKMDEFHDKAERESIVLNEGKNIEYKLPPIIDNRAYARMLPKDWKYQILQLAKEGSNDKQK